LSQGLLRLQCGMGWMNDVTLIVSLLSHSPLPDADEWAVPF
jgi:hypothetical protein